MAADSTLVEGAYRAARPVDMGKRAAQEKLSDNIASTVGRLKKEKESDKAEAKKEAAKKATEKQGANTTVVPPVEEEKVKAEDKNNVAEVENQVELAINEGVALTPGDDENISADLEGLRSQVNEALLGKDKNKAAKITENVRQMRDDKESMSFVLNNIGQDYRNIGNTTAHGYGMNLENDPIAKKWMQNLILAQEKLDVSDPDKDGNTRYGVYGPDGTFMTPNQLTDYLVQFEVDNSSFNEIDELAEGYRDKGSEGSDQFDRDTAMKSVQRIVDSGNFKSLMHDSSFGSTSFVEDLMAGEELSGMTYSELGLDAPAGDDDGVINREDNISKGLKRKIVNNFTSHPEYKGKAKEAVIKYYTDYLQRNYNKAASKVERNTPADRFDLFNTKSGFTNKQTPLPPDFNPLPNKMSVQDYINESI